MYFLIMGEIIYEWMLDNFSSYLFSFRNISGRLDGVDVYLIDIIK